MTHHQPNQPSGAENEADRLGDQHREESLALPPDATVAPPDAAAGEAEHRPAAEQPATPNVPPLDPDSTDGEDDTSSDRALPPIPDGGLAAAMPDWLRAAPTSTLPTPGRPAPPFSSATGENASLPSSDPTGFLGDDDLPSWIRDLVAKEQSAEAASRVAAEPADPAHAVPAGRPSGTAARRPALPKPEPSAPTGASRAWLARADQSPADPFAAAERGDRTRSPFADIVDHDARPHGGDRPLAAAQPAPPPLAAEMAAKPSTDAPPLVGDPAAPTAEPGVEQAPPPPATSDGASLPPAVTPARRRARGEASGRLVPILLVVVLVLLVFLFYALSSGMLDGA